MQSDEEQLVDFERLKQLVSERSILWREHALQRMNERQSFQARSSRIIPMHTRRRAAWSWDARSAASGFMSFAAFSMTWRLSSQFINRIPASGCQMEKRGGNRDEMLYVQRRFGARS